MKKKVLFFVNIIAPYNISVFNRISDLLDWEVFFYFDQTKEFNRSWEIPKDAIRFNYKIENSWKIKKVSKVGNKASIQKTVYFPFFILRRIWKDKPTVVVSIEFGLRTIFSLLMCRLIGAKMLIISDVTATTEANIGRLKKIIRKRIAGRIDGAIARSYNAKAYLKSLGLDEMQVTVAPYATETADIDQFSQPSKIHSLIETINGRRKDKFCFLYTGHFTQLKGVDILIKIVEKLPSDVKSKLIIVLAGGTDDELCTISSVYDKDIFFPLGFISNSDLTYLYKMVDCFILPTRSDTWGLVVNEAVTAGCPVMVSKYAGSAGELIEDGLTGVIFDPLDEKQFIEKLVFCIENKYILRSFSMKAKEKLKEYNNDISANRFVNHIVKHLN